MNILQVAACNPSFYHIIAEQNSWVFKNTVVVVQTAIRPNTKAVR